MLDCKMSLKYIKFFALLILALGAAGPASASCYGYEWTYNWESPYDNRNAWGCDCSETSDGYRIYKKDYNTKNYWDGGTQTSGGAKRKCNFPNYSRCNNISGSQDKWEACAGVWINPDSPLSTSVTKLTDGMTAEMTNTGWLWSCKEGYTKKSDNSGCVSIVNPCGTDGTKVLYKGQCYDKPASGYGFNYTPDKTVVDSVVECSTKTLTNGLVYQKLFDGYICITCPANTYIRNTDMWFEDGNCGAVKKVNQYKFTECAKKGLVDKDLENCLLN